MFQTTPSTNAPVRYKTPQNFSQTFSGPITTNPDVQRTARNDSMAKAAFSGDMRGYLGQMGKGVGAGSKMAGYRAGLAADSNASKSYAQAQQDWLGMLTDNAAAGLSFQERQAGEQNWLRSLLLDRDDVRNRERNAALDRILNRETRAYKRRAEDSVAQANREAMMASAIFGGL